MRDVVVVPLVWWELEGLGERRGEEGESTYDIEKDGGSGCSPLGLGLVIVG